MTWDLFLGLRKLLPGLICRMSNLCPDYFPRQPPLRLTQTPFFRLFPLLRETLSQLVPKSETLPAAVSLTKVTVTVMVQLEPPSRDFTPLFSPRPSSLRGSMQIRFWSRGGGMAGGNVQILAERTESICDNCNSQHDNYTTFTGLCRVTLLISEKYLYCVRNTGASPALHTSLSLH